MKWLRIFLAPAPRRKARPRVMPRLESLERRDTPAVTFHGGAVLSPVEVQAIYYGTAWSATSPNAQGFVPAQVAAQLDGELQYLVKSPFMDELAAAGYGVVRGTFNQGRIYTFDLADGSTLTDGAIQSNLQTKISDGSLQDANPERLYVVFVQPDVVVQQANGAFSTVFTGYHSAFAGTNVKGQSVLIHYAVIPTPGGAVGNASAAPTLAPADAISVALTQQLADAVTDPDLGYRTKGWYDDAGGAEIGAANGAPPVELNGYAVAQVINQGDVPMAVGQDQVAVIPNAGVWRYEDVTGWEQLTTAQATQAVIDSNGDVAVEIQGFGVWRWEDASGWQQLSPIDASQISMAGAGVVAATRPGSGVWRYMDAFGWQQLTPAVPTQIAVDANGDVAAAIQGFGVWRFGAFTGQWSQLTTAQATQVAMDSAGDVAVAIAGAGVWRYQGGGWAQLTTADPTHLAMDASGDVAVTIAGAGVWRYKNGGWAQLTTADASSVAISGNGIVSVEIAGAGVWRYEDELTWANLTATDVSFLDASE